MGLCASEAALLCVALSSSQCPAVPQHITGSTASPLQQLIHSVQTPVVLFWFLVIIDEKLGLAVPVYGILDLEG